MLGKQLLVATALDFSPLVSRSERVHDHDDQVLLLDHCKEPRLVSDHISHEFIFAHPGSHRVIQLDLVQNREVFNFVFQRCFLVASAVVVPACASAFQLESFQGLASLDPVLCVPFGENSARQRVVLPKIVEADGEGYCRLKVALLVDFLARHSQNPALGRHVRVFDLGQIALLSDDPAHAADADDELLLGEKAPHESLNQHDVAEDDLSSAQERPRLHDSLLEKCM